MFIQKFPLKLVTDEVFDYVADSPVKRLVKYVIDRRYRKAVLLSPWLKEQVENPEKEVVEFAKTIPSYKRYDTTVRAVLRRVREVTYTGDHKLWGVFEKWQTAIETLTSMKGDCEDGAILMYVLCRLKGIPENRLELIAGEVMNRGKIEGHCWLAYRPEEYPINYVFLDWCYWYSDNSVSSRDMYSIIGDRIFTPKGTPDRYKKMWFAFTENDSHISMRPKWAGEK